MWFLHAPLPAQMRDLERLWWVLCVCIRDEIKTGADVGSVSTAEKEIVCNFSVNSTKAGNYFANFKGEWWVKGDKDKVLSSLSGTIPCG